MVQTQIPTGVGKMIVVDVELQTTFLDAGERRSPIADRYFGSVWSLLQILPQAFAVAACEEVLSSFGLHKSAGGHVDVPQVRREGILKSLLSGSIEQVLTNNLVVVSRAATDGAQLVVPYNGGRIVLEFVESSFIEGSIFRRDRVRLRVEAQRHETIAEKVIVGVLVTALGTATVASGTAIYTSWPNPTYICSVNSIVNQPFGKDVLIEAVSDLQLPAGASIQKQRSVYYGRQSCLKALGFDPGPIDGHPTQLLSDAERRYSEATGVYVNWDSVPFVRTILETGARRAILR